MKTFKNLKGLQQRLVGGNSSSRIALQEEKETMIMWFLFDCVVTSQPFGLFIRNTTSKVEWSKGYYHIAFCEIRPEAPL
jgi:hypothetical protein